MKLALLLSVLVIAGCAATREQMAAQSNYDVCRFTMGGPHSQVAHFESQRRGLDCTQYYGAINARMQAESAATAQFINSIDPTAAATTTNQLHELSHREHCAD